MLASIDGKQPSRKASHAMVRDSSRPALGAIFSPSAASRVPEAEFLRLVVLGGLVVIGLHLNRGLGTEKPSARTAAALGVPT